MTTKRRRWLTALGIFLATALGGVVAYLASRRRKREPAPEEASVSELLSRLRREAANRETRSQRRLHQRHNFPLLGRRRRPAATPPAQPGSEEGSPDAVASESAGEDAANDSQGLSRRYDGE